MPDIVTQYEADRCADHARNALRALKHARAELRAIGHHIASQDVAYLDYELDEAVDIIEHRILDNLALGIEHRPEHVR